MRATIQKVDLGEITVSMRPQWTFNLNSYGLSDEVQTSQPFVQIYEATDLSTATGAAKDTMVYARSYDTSENTCSVEVEASNGTAGKTYFLFVRPTLQSGRKYAFISYFKIRQPVAGASW